jgi:hypothetical protein
MLVRHLMTGAASLAFCAGANAAITIQPLALSGHDDALGPGENTGRFFDNSTLGGATGCINLRGDVVFRALDTAQTPNQGVWQHSASAGTNVPIALNGWLVGNYTYGNSNFNLPLIDNSGHTAWRYSTSALFGNNGSGPAVTAVQAGAEPGGYPTFSAPDTGGATIAAFHAPDPQMNSAGDNMFVADLTPTTGDPPVTITPAATNNQQGIWSGPPGATHLRVRQNDLYPGTLEADNLRIGGFANSGSSVSFNGSGQILISAGVQGNVNSTSGSANNAALLKYTPGSGLAAVAREGDHVPGVENFYYNAIGVGVDADMNDAGKVAFAWQLRDNPTGGAIAGRGLFSDTTGTLTMHARTGGNMPAIAHANGSEFSGVQWGSTISNVVINHSGSVMFYNSGMTGGNVSPTGSNDSGLFIMDNTGAFTKVMRLGDPAPAHSTTGGGVTFNTVQNARAFNALGQVAFVCLLSSTDGGVNGQTGNNEGLFAVDARGNTYAIAQTATAFQVAPGDTRTVAGVGAGGIGSIVLSGGEDGRATSLNDNGVLVFTLNFLARTAPDPNPIPASSGVFYAMIPTFKCGSADFNCDGDVGTDADIESFFACLAGNCPSLPCTSSADFNADGDVGTDSDIEAFFRVLGGGAC